MHSLNNEDTIVGVATAFGDAGVSIVRVSGKNSVDIASHIFRAKNKIPLSLQGSHTVCYGHIVDNLDVIDEVLVVVMRSPKTYTKEDTVEIQCHGGLVSSQIIVKMLIKSGARLALAGEFTKRAFLNGRIDLSQAESVLDVISSKTQLEHKQAVSGLRGELSSKIKFIGSKLVDVLSEIEAYIDFPDEQIEIEAVSIINNIESVLCDLRKLYSSASLGRILKEGIKVCISGAPNVGKSSLLNSILKQERVIVSDIAGTTRDIIDETVVISGVKVRFYDTAGIDEFTSILEKKAVEKSIAALESADIILLVIDGSRGITDADMNIVKLVEHKNVIVVVNKSDLMAESFNKNVFEGTRDIELVEVSALLGSNIDVLEGKIVNTIYKDGIKSQDDNVIITNTRHKQCLENAIAFLENSKTAFKDNLSFEFVASDVKQALDSIGMITGEYVTEDVLNRVFEKFCIGK